MPGTEAECALPVTLGSLSPYETTNEPRSPTSSTGDGTDGSVKGTFLIRFDLPINPWNNKV